MGPPLFLCSPLHLLTGLLVERRALFLSKVHAPPSPTATITPKTPPDSPAIFHYSLPSPGLVSPLAMFDTLHDNNDTAPLTWVEQVDFRLPDDHKQVARNLGLFRDGKMAQVLPSLDQISARLKTLASARSTTIVDGLRPPAVALVSAPLVPSNGQPTIEVGRLRMPVRAAKSPPAVSSELPPQPASVANSPPKVPVSPPFPSDLRVTTTVVPRTATASPTQLTESNLKILDARERRAHNMLSTLRRRTLSTPQQPLQTTPLVKTAGPGTLTKNAARRTMPLPLPDDVVESGSMESRKSRWKRHSAPADLMPRDRTGFEHPVFALPGAF